jgi:hypothetical protein
MEAVASSAPEVPYQIIDGVMARAQQADAERDHPLSAWIITQNLPEFPGAFVARLVTDGPTLYILLGHTLVEVQVQLPLGLVHSGREPSDPPAVVEAWFPE